MIALSQSQLARFVPVAQAFIITDLDECSINSDHRRAFEPLTGELNLKAWQDNSTGAEIAQDTLRPWGFRFAELVGEREDCTFAICTSREFIAADFAYMEDHLNISDSEMIWHRPTGCMSSREGLKHDLFVKAMRAEYELLFAINQGRAFFFDDKVKNVLAAEALGIQGVLVYQD